MTHCRLPDYLAYRLEGTPLPCTCPPCAERVRRWEADRAAAAGAADALPPPFWTAQEARLGRRAERPAYARPWALAAAGTAALLLLAGGLGLLLPRPKADIDDYETRYAAVQAALERPALGGLEACGVLLDETEEGGTAAEEAL